MPMSPKEAGAVFLRLPRMTPTQSQAFACPAGRRISYLLGMCEVS